MIKRLTKYLQHNEDPDEGSSSDENSELGSVEESEDHGSQSGSDDEDADEAADSDDTEDSDYSADGTDRKPLRSKKAALLSSGSEGRKRAVGELLESSDDEEDADGDAGDADGGKESGGAAQRLSFKCNLCPERELRSEKQVQEHLKSKVHLARERDLKKTDKWNGLSEREKASILKRKEKKKEKYVEKVAARNKRRLMEKKEEARKKMQQQQDHEEKEKGTKSKMKAKATTAVDGGTLVPKDRSSSVGKRVSAVAVSDVEHVEHTKHVKPSKKNRATAKAVEMSQEDREQEEEERSRLVSLTKPKSGGVRKSSKIESVSTRDPSPAPKRSRKATA
eukprot:ANDGO_06311.mRNA.1 hypothetical protein